MPKTTETQKSTAMDYLAAPRGEGIVKNLMALLGFQAPKGGRLPVGVKYDTLVAMNDVLSAEISAKGLYPNLVEDGRKETNIKEALLKGKRARTNKSRQFFAIKLLKFDITLTPMTNLTADSPIYLA